MPKKWKVIDIDSRLQFALSQVEPLCTLALQGLASAKIEKKGSGVLDAGSIVTTLDPEIQERFLRAVAAAFPNDERRGEESSASINAARNAGERLVWVIDPIDGTWNFSENIGYKIEEKKNPFWGISIGCLKEKADGSFEPLVSVVAYPMQGTVVYSSKGKGAFEAPIVYDAEGNSVFYRDNPTRLKLRQPMSGRKVQMGGCYLGKSEGLGIQWQQIKGQFYSTRVVDGLRAMETMINRGFEPVAGNGSFTSSMLKFLHNESNAYIDPSLGLHDIAAMVGIVTEAGGVVDVSKSSKQDKDGNPLYRCYFAAHNVMLQTLQNPMLLPPFYQKPKSQPSLYRHEGTSVYNAVAC